MGNFKIDAVGRRIDKTGLEDVPVYSMPPLKETETKSRTIQSQAVGITVGEIAKNFGLSKLAMFAPMPEQFLDVSDVPDVFTVLNWRKQLDDYFLTLPSSLRDRFRNDPMGLVKFIQDPKNDNEALELGLLKLTDKGKEMKISAAAAAKVAADKLQADFEANVRAVKAQEDKKGL